MDSIGIQLLRAAATRLEGLAVRGADRAADMEVFMFGPDVTFTPRHLPSRVVPRFGIHVQCAWRIVHQHRVVVGSADYFEVTNPDPAGDDPIARRSKFLQAFFAQTKRSIASATATDVGDLAVAFSDGTTLDVFVDSASGDNECYRLTEIEGPHVIVTGADVRQVSVGSG
jgi:hypothetical protein